MIAIIIAESEDNVSELSQKLNNEGYKIIRYTWLLKALDNLEEIEPQRIYVNALDYPRHWKTLAQFTNANFISSKPEVILYNTENFDKTEKEKAHCLNVQIIEDIKNINQIKETLMLINPHTQKLILGSLSLIKTKSIIFVCENTESLRCLKANDFIYKTIIKKDNKITEPVLKITSIHNNTIHMEIL